MTVLDLLFVLGVMAAWCFIALAVGLMLLFIVAAARRRRYRRRKRRPGPLPSGTYERMIDDPAWPDRQRQMARQGRQ